MTTYLLRRLALLVPVLFGVSLVTFSLVRLIPGDAALIAIGVDQRTTPEIVERVRKSYGLDDPMPVQYVKWLGHVVRGDLGNSLRTRRPVADELRLRIPITVELAVLATLVAIGPSIVLGTLSAMKRNSALDYLATMLTLVGISVPNFFLAIVFVLVFSFWLRWLPPVRFAHFTDDPAQHIKIMIMPAVALGLPLTAVLMRNTRSAVLEVLGQDYVRVARSKGLAEQRVIRRHVLPNAALPVLTVGGIQFASLLGGTVIIERIFGLPGMGQYIVDAIDNRDYPVVQGTTLVVATMFVVISLVVDVLYAFFDPRLRTRS